MTSTVSDCSSYRGERSSVAAGRKKTGTKIREREREPGKERRKEEEETKERKN
jgi:hypothetical protein